MGGGQSVRVDSIGIAHYLGVARTDPLYHYTATLRNIDNEKDINKFRRGDFYIAEIDTTTILNGIPINEISNPIDEKYLDIVPLEVYSFGYANDRFISYANIIGKTIIGNYKEANPLFNDNLTTEELYSLKKSYTTTMFEFTINSKDSIQEGMSGAPIWGKFLIGHRVEYKLIGLLIAKNYLTGKGISVKWKEIMQELDSKLSKHP